MAGRKQKPCEWCDGELFLRTDEGAKNVQGHIEIYPDIGAISVYFFGISDDGETTHEQSYHLPMNFCPNCGRRLGY